MERVRKFLASMSKAEVRYLRTFLQAFVGKGEDNKALALVDMLLAYPDTSPEDASETLYGSPTSGAFKMMVSRLEDRILESLQLEANLSKNEGLKQTPIGLERVKLYRRLTQGILLQSRGLATEAGEIFGQIAREANQFGLYDIKLEALHYFHAIAMRGQWTDAHIADQRATFQQHQAVHEAQLLHNSLQHIQHLSSSKAAHLQEKYLASELPRLGLLVETAKAPAASYLYLQLLRIQAHLNDDLAQEATIIGQLQTLVAETPILQLSHRTHSLAYNKGLLFLRMYHFETSIEQLQPLLQQVKIDKQNAIYLALSYATLYLNRWQDTFRFSGAIVGKFAPIATYLMAVTYWKLGDFRSAKRCLSTCDTLLEDKEGWNIGLRTFEIILLIDSGEQDLASAKTESLRKHIERYNNIEKRELFISKYLRALDKNAFAFSAPSKEMLQLQAQIADTRWFAFSHEVVRFDVWVSARSQSISYEAAFRQATQPVPLPYGF